MRKLPFFVVTVAHFFVDSYATMLTPTLPIFVDRLELSHASAGLLGMIVSVCNVSQPLLGVWADGMRRRWLVLAGLALVSVFMPLMGVAPSYWTLVAMLCLGGIGVAAFHPQVFSLAGELAGNRRFFGLSLFTFGGTMGLGVTPLWAAPMASRIGLEWLPVVGLPGLIFLFVLWRVVPLDNPHMKGAGKRPSLLEGLDGAGRHLALITAVVILRSMTTLGYGFFLTVLAKERGLSDIEWGVTLSVYNVSGVVGSLIFGYLADRISPRPLVWGTLILSAPCLYLYLGAEGILAYVLLTLGGGLLMASNSILVALAQELAPKSSGLASSLPLGFSWGVGSLALYPVGWIADQIGLTGALAGLAWLPLVSAIPAFFLPNRPAKLDEDKTVTEAMT
ncbi:MAG: MFS transporter [Candidatus Latescibacterota bacterium]|nr:MFS transporter [Candidatus Latescibacterota bacterium]